MRKPWTRPDRFIHIPMVKAVTARGLFSLLVLSLVLGISACSSLTGKGGSPETGTSRPGETGIFRISGKDKEEPVTREIFAMDTYMTLTVYKGSEEVDEGRSAEKGDQEQAAGKAAGEDQTAEKRAEKALDAAEAEIARIEQLMSTGLPDSEISLLNRTGEADVSEDTACLVRRSKELYEDTDGLFDITVYPLMKAWGFDTGSYRIPEDRELKDILSHMGADKIVLDEPDMSRSSDSPSDGGNSVEGNSSPEGDSSREGDSSPEGDSSREGDNSFVSNKQNLTHVAFSDKAMEIDLGGIAKGYTSGRVKDIFREYGIRHAIVSLGGNVDTLGEKPDGSSWKVAVRDPDDTSAYAGVIQVKDRAVVTSGGYERYFTENGRYYHHIIDPDSGYPARSGLKSVTIISEDSTLADGLSTALYIMGKDKAADYWRKHSDDFDMILISEDGSISVSQGIADSFSSERNWEIIKN